METVPDPECPADDRPSTAGEASREYARNVGRERPNVEWICSHFDLWERNPFYTGKPGRHPEDDRDETDGAITDIENAATRFIPGCDDCPF